MTVPNFGVVIERPNVEPVPVLGADFSKIGMVSTSADASNSVLPLGVAKRFNTRDAALLAGMGTGFIADAINAINDQMGPLGSSADICIVRVAVGGSEAATLQNVVDGLQVLRAAPDEINMTPRLIMCPGYTAQVTSVGGTIDVQRTADGGNTGNGLMTLAGTPHLAGVKAGIYEVEITGGTKSAAAAVAGEDNVGDGTVGSLTADSTAAVGTWTLLCMEAAANGGKFLVKKPDGSVDSPGLATVGSAYNSTSGINFTIADGATDFAVGDVFTIAVAHAVPANGGAFSVTDPDGIVLTAGTVGTPYATQIAFTIADGSTDFVVGDKWEVEVTITDAQLTANPVVVELPSVLAGLMAIAVVDAPNSSLNASENWRETIQSDRIMAVGVGALVMEDGEIVERPMAPRVIGLIVRNDNAFGGRPFNPFANQPIYGIVGTSRNIPFSLLDGAVEGQLMLAADISVVVRGQLGVDSAIADGGFVFIGVDSLAEGELWAQIHQVRGADYIAVKLIQIARVFLGRAINADTAEAWLNSIKFMLRDHKARNDILGYKVEFPPSLNSPEEIRLGRLTVTPHIEPCPAFKRAQHQILRYRPALDELVAEIVARLAA